MVPEVEVYIAVSDRVQVGVSDAASFTSHEANVNRTENVVQNSKLSTLILVPRRLVKCAKRTESGMEKPLTASTGCEPSVCESKCQTMPIVHC